MSAAQTPKRAAGNGWRSGEGPFCVNCGAALAPPARFCMRCGREQPETAAGQPGPAGGRRSRRFRLAAAAVGVLVALGAAGAVFLLQDHRGQPQISQAEARALVDRYVAAYSARDLDAMRALLASDFQGRTGGGAVENRSATLQGFAVLFAYQASYRLSDVRVTTGKGRALVSGSYEITPSSQAQDPGLVRGRISFLLERRRGELLIAGSTTTPSGVRPTPVPGPGPTPTPGPTPAPGPSPAPTPEPTPTPTPTPAHYARTATIKTWWNGSYVHFKAVDDSSGYTVVEALGSDSANLGAEQAALLRTSQREALVDQLKQKMIAVGWEEIGLASGGEWYQLQFGHR